MKFAKYLAYVPLLLGAAARADSVLLAGGQTVSGAINGLRAGELSLVVDGKEQRLDVSSVQSIAVDAVPYFAAAEAVRGEPLKAVVLYKQLIQTVNRAELRQLAQLRAIGPIEQDGRWNEAVSLFLEVYGASPVEAIWKVRPTRMPLQDSRMLTESAQAITASFASIKNDDARRNLRTWLLEIYQRAGDTAGAQRVAMELGGAAAAMASALPGPVSAADQPVIDALFARARDEESAKELQQAVVTWMRVAARVPDTVAAAEALLRAATLQEELKRSEAAKVLYQEVVARYPTTREAASAKVALARN